MKRLETYFIRHNNALDEKTRRRLLKQHCIFIHYPWDKKTDKHRRFDSSSTDPDDYERRGAKMALGALKQLAKNGGYVCAQMPEQKKWMVGFIPAKSHVKLFKGRWNPAVGARGR